MTERPTAISEGTTPDPSLPITFIPFIPYTPLNAVLKFGRPLKLRILAPHCGVAHTHTAKGFIAHPF